MSSTGRTTPVPIALMPTIPISDVVCLIALAAGLGGLLVSRAALPVGVVSSLAFLADPATVGDGQCGAWPRVLATLVCARPSSRHSSALAVPNLARTDDAVDRACRRRRRCCRAIITISCAHRLMACWSASSLFWASALICLWLRFSGTARKHQTSAGLPACTRRHARVRWQAVGCRSSIWLTGWTPIDPLLSLLIGGLVLAASLRLLRDALHGLMDGVPFTIDLEHLGKELAAVPRVIEVHDLHVWSLSGERLALTAHVRIANLSEWPAILAALQHAAAEHGINHPTFQPETIPWAPLVRQAR